jgi:hypothetical protein
MDGWQIEMWLDSGGDSDFDSRKRTGSCLWLAGYAKFVRINEKGNGMGMIEWVLRILSFFSEPAKTGFPDVDEYRSCPRNIALSLLAAFAFLGFAHIFSPDDTLESANEYQLVLNGALKLLAMGAAIGGSLFKVAALWFIYRWIRLRWLLRATD